MKPTKIPLNAIDGGLICRTILATYHKIGAYNVFQHLFPSVIEQTNNKDMSKIYRIRKLTSRECFRLMGVSDSDIDKVKEAGISESQQYKMAGNSIVVQVLEGIFTQMFRKDSDALF